MNGNKTRANADIRNRMAASGIFQWEVADQLGIADSTMIRWMRRELSESHRNAILHAISVLSGEVEV